MRPERKRFYVLEANRINSLIQEHFGREFSYHADQEVGNHNDTFSFDGYMDHWGDKAVLEFIQTGKYSWLFHDLMNRLVMDGVLPAGDYVIEGAW